MSSMTTPPAKILLTSSTKVSLNDRFTKLAKVRAETAPAAVPIGVKTSPGVTAAAAAAARNQASAKSRALALQMAQRPSVQAALKLKQNMRQRLSGGAGSAPKRLQQSIGVSPARAANLARRLSGGGGGGGARFGNNIGNRLKFVPRQRQMSLPNRQSPRVFTNKKFIGGGGGPFKARQPGTVPRSNKPKPMNAINNINNNTNGGVKIMNPEPIKKSLDMELDEYMSKSKSHLDADLNAYMAKSKSHLDADLDTYMAQAAPQ